MRHTFASGGDYENYYGYSRAVRVGDVVHVAGTCARGDAAQSPDAHVQAVSALEVVEEALREAGASLADVTRTVTYVTSLDHVDGVARAHAAVFGEIRPAATCVVVTSLVAPHLLVEIQVDAIVPAN